MPKRKIELTDEQEVFVQRVLSGRNVLVDACYGSGKTTAIQSLCDRLPKNKRIVYLTYNRLLKADARARIKNPNAFVTNYHGYALAMLSWNGVSCGVPDLLQTFKREKPRLKPLDVLILDEYQDIDLEISEMLEEIKRQFPKIQIVAVGDMAQKIYDKTTLDAAAFIERFLGEHELLEFTQCFRSCSEYAEKMGRIWKKKIVGVNKKSRVQNMTVGEVRELLSKENPKNVLCLGMRTGEMAKTLNYLESNFPDKYNKRTVFASIRDTTGSGGSGMTEPKKTSAIFTTFDSSKGLERKICVVFDYTKEYWYSRVNKPGADCSIIRNVFCVAATRGKDLTVFVLPDPKKNDTLLDERTISQNTENDLYSSTVNISDMFDFKYKEDVEECFSILDIKKVLQEDTEPIEARVTDDLIDLSPCIGIYQEAAYFDGYDIDSAIESFFETHPEAPEWKKRLIPDFKTLDEKILFLTSLETNQDRYIRQVKPPLASEEVREKIFKRLGSCLERGETEQISCQMILTGEEGEVVYANGFADVLKNGIVYELKFVHELSHENFLQCACYMTAMGLSCGILWNIRNNDMYVISVKDTDKFKKLVLKTVTKGRVK